MTDEKQRRAASHARAKHSLEETAKGALDALAPGTDILMPGAGTLISLLVKHAGGALVARRERKIEAFLRRLLDEQLTDKEKTERLKDAVDNEDFQMLLELLDRDIESAKAEIYALAYLQIVEGNVPQKWRGDFIPAVAALRAADFCTLAAVLANETSPKREHARHFIDEQNAGSVRRLENVGALDPADGTRAPTANEFGRLLAEVLRAEIANLPKP